MHSGCLFEVTNFYMCSIIIPYISPFRLFSVCNSVLGVRFQNANREQSRRMTGTSCVAHEDGANIISRLDDPEVARLGSWMHLATVIILTVSFSTFLSVIKAANSNNQVPHTTNSCHSHITATAGTTAASGMISEPDDQDGYCHDNPRLSNRVRETEAAHIEAVLSKYADIKPSPANLAQVF